MDYYLYVKSFGAVFVKLAANNTGENFLLLDMFQIQSPMIKADFWRSVAEALVRVFTEIILL